MSTLGLDISNLQGVVSLAATGKAFVFPKASQGTWFVDQFFAANVAMAKQAGLLIIPYGFMEPWRPPCGPQAAFLLAQIGAVGGMRPGWRVMLDWEDVPGSGLPRDADLLAGALDAHGLLYRALGIKSYLYSNVDYLTRHNLVGHPELAAIADLHLAAWDVAAPPAVAPWGVARMWQYSDSGSVAGVGLVDLDRFDGTIDELRASGWPSTPSPLPGPVFPPPDVAVNQSGEAVDVNAAALTIVRHAEEIMAAMVQRPAGWESLVGATAALVGADGSAIAKVSGLLSR